MIYVLLLLQLYLSSNYRYIQIEDLFISSNNITPENNLIPSTEEMSALVLVLTCPPES